MLEEGEGTLMQSIQTGEANNIMDILFSCAWGIEHRCYRMWWTYPICSCANMPMQFQETWVRFCINMKYNTLSSNVKWRMYEHCTPTVAS